MIMALDRHSQVPKKLEQFSVFVHFSRPPGGTKSDRISRSPLVSPFPPQPTRETRTFPWWGRSASDLGWAQERRPEPPRENGPSLSCCRGRGEADVRTGEAPMTL